MFNTVIQSNIKYSSKLKASSIFKPVKNNQILKRSMLSSTKNLTAKVSTSFYRSYSTKEAFKVKGKAAKDLANDGTGKHTHIGKQECILQDCASKKCTALCAIPDKTRILGHNTHKPPVGRFTRLISYEDINGDQKPQITLQLAQLEEKVSEYKEKVYDPTGLTNEDLRQLYEYKTHIYGEQKNDYSKKDITNAHEKDSANEVD